MFRILKLVLLAAATNCAPATFVPFAAPFTQPYFFLGPQPQYQTLLKLQQPAIQQPAVPAAKIDSPKNQYVFLYPNAPQIPLIALRQDNGNAPDFFQQINNFWNDLSSAFTSPTEEKPVEPAPEESGKMMEKKMEMMQVPASTMPLNKQRFYLINSLPQFYAPFPTAAIANPIVAVEPLRARSAVVDSIPAENEKVDQIRAQDMSEPMPQPAVVQAIPQLQLRGNFIEPLQHLQIDQPQVPVVGPEMAAEQVARYLDAAAPNVVNNINENDANQLRGAELSDEEMSNAQAMPTGIAISGKGGVSSSSSVATAVVGENGQALASPTSIALSGDFDNQEMILKQTEPMAQP